MDKIIGYILNIEDNVLVNVEPKYEEISFEYLNDYADFEDFEIADEDDWEFYEDSWDFQEESCSVVAQGSDSEVNFDEDDKQQSGDEMEERQVEPVEYISEADEIVVPEGIVKIGRVAFRKCREVRTVILPESLVEIDAFAFYGCECLEHLDLPENIVRIGESAFSSCYSLEKIKLPHGLKKLEDYLFSDCKALEQVTIPESVEEIGNSVFWRCRKLSKLQLPKNLKKIGDRLFASMAGFAGLVLPAAVTSIHPGNFEDGAGMDWSNHEGVNTPYRIGIDWLAVEDGNQTFRMENGMLLTMDGKTLLYCPRSVQGKVTIPEGVVSIGRAAFWGCLGISEIQFPDSVEKFGLASFSNCSNLQKVVLPPKLSTLPESVFVSCNKLKNIQIHENISYIGPSAFCNCNALKELVIPSNVRIIETNAFAGSWGLERVEISEGTWKIGKEAFYNCINLKKIRIPDSVEMIGEAAFERCRQVTIECYMDSEAERHAYENDIPYRTDWMEIPEDEPVQEMWAWEEGLENPFCRIENGIVYSKDGTMLLHCLEEYQGTVVVPEGVKMITADAFFQCEGVEKVILPEGLLYIGKSAFYECSSLKEVYLPESLLEIEEQVFSWCEKLEIAELPKELKALGKEAFLGTALKTLSLPSSLNWGCGEDVFEDCKNLSYVSMPQYFEGLDLEDCLAFFKGCDALEHIIIEENGRECGLEDDGEYYTIEDLVICRRKKSIVYYPPGKKGVLRIPEGIEWVEIDGFSGKCKMSGIVFPASWKEKWSCRENSRECAFERMLNSCLELEFVEVHKENPYCASENGLLLSKDKKELLYCPKKMQGIVTIPEGVEDIELHVFEKCSFITEIHFPMSYEGLYWEFSGCDSLKEISISKSIKLFGRDISELVQNAILKQWDFHVSIREK